jgi:alpha-L-rhamnosidase
VEEAYRLLFYEEYPSWLNMVKRGATTVWERWDGIRPDGTFQKSQMNSFNHPALGSVGDWLYRYVAGIDLDAEIPGFKAMVIKPYPGGKMKNASATYESLYGKISSEWKIEGEKIRLKVEIPVNTTASIYLPSTGDQLMVNGQPSSQTKIEKDQVLNYHFLKIETGSGTWEFESDFVLQSRESSERSIDNRMHLFNLDEIQNQQDN